MDPRQPIKTITNAFRAGALTPRLLLETCLDRIERFNPHINAVLDLRADEALAEADQSAERWRSGNPLSDIDGVPFGVKANIAVNGLPFHAGVGAYRERLADRDAQCVAQLKLAGAIPIGTLNMHEGALGATTDNPHFGRCHNPWEYSRTPGGSSGGSGASVAGGFCAFALGTDTMGSVRIPSAYCGIAGHKPTYGLISSEGLVDLSPTLDHIGPHALYADDLALVMSVLAGDNKLEEAAPPELRIGIAQWHDRVDVEPGIVQQFEAAIPLLQKMGTIDEVDLSSFDFGALRRRGLLVSEVEGYRVHQAMLKTDPDGFSTEFASLLRWGHQQSEEKQTKAYEAIKSAGAAFAELVSRFDVVVMPTAPQGPFAFEDNVPANQADFTCLANFAGLPATTVPMAGAGTPPPSLQFIASKGADKVGLMAAKRFEDLRGVSPLPDLG